MRHGQTRFGRGQIAMEYLATYGWALFAMFAVIAILVASGMLGAGRYGSEECTFAPNLPCNNAYFVRGASDTEMTMHLNITNTQGFPMYITDCYYRPVGGVELQQLGGDPACDLKRITGQGESLQYDVPLSTNSPIRQSEVRRVYVTYTFKNCQDAPAPDPATSCFADDVAYPRHNTSGLIVAIVRG